MPTTGGRATCAQVVAAQQPGAGSDGDGGQAQQQRAQGGWQDDVGAGDEQRDRHAERVVRNAPP